MFEYRRQLILLSLLVIVYCHSSDNNENRDSNESRDSDDDSYHSEEDSHHHKRKPRFVCPKGWQYSERIRSPWCIKVFPALVQPEGIDHQSAQDSCANEGAVLSGIENAKESSWIQKQTFAILHNASLVSCSVWIGAQRRYECMGEDRMNLPECLPSANNAFEWTDHHTTGKSGFVWTINAPFYLNHAQPYVTMFIIGENDPTVPPGVTSGSMDDIAGHVYIASQPFVTLRAFACGKLATKIN